MNEEEKEPRKSRSNRPHKTPAQKPVSANRFTTEAGNFVNRRQRKRDDRAAVGTDRQMRESLLLLVSRQSVFDKSVELVRVWMVPGLKEFAHDWSDAGVGAEAVLLENDAV